MKGVAMTAKHPRIPAIRSEIAIAIAFLGLSIRQLAEFSALVGHPVSERFLEESLDTPWPAYRSKADPVQIDNLVHILGSLGVGLQDGVFGIVRASEIRIPVSLYLNPVSALLSLAQNCPDGHVRLAIQEPKPGSFLPRPAFLLNTGNQFLLSDNANFDASEFVSGLFANCLGRLWVSETRVPCLAALPVDQAVARLQQTEMRSALNLSKTRVLELLKMEA